MLLILFFQGCNFIKSNENKSIEGLEKVMLFNDGSTEFYYFELENKDELWESELGEITALEKYKDSLKLQLGNKKYEEAIKKESQQTLGAHLLERALDGDSINALLVHTRSIGIIRNINFIESYILNYQIGRFPMLSRPTEFHGFILKNEETEIIRVYFGASNTEWPPHPTIILNELDKLSNDWKLIYHLHNHYCKKENDYVGILAPSLADAQYYKMLKERFSLEKALITNGFHTVEIDKEDFEKFESH